MVCEPYGKRVVDRRLKSLVADADPSVYWTDRQGRPEFERYRPGRGRSGAVDLVVVGGGFTGLWAALAAVEENPGRSVVLLEAKTVGHGASTRNGGFCDASLTHGLANGVAHWPKEIDTLLRLGDKNLAGLLADLDRLGLPSAARPAAILDVAVTDWQADSLAEAHRLQQRHGRRSKLLTESEVQDRVQSPLYRRGLIIDGSMALVDPAAVTWGLAEAARSAGAQIYERTPVAGIEPQGRRLAVAVPGGTISADRVIVATNAWAGPGRSLRRRIVPVYDHVLMTEPLSEAQRDQIGWRGGEGISDVGSQFHYYRMTDDHRILWGGYDANYYYGSRVKAGHEDRPASHELLADHFFRTFPALDGLRFTHRWAGPIGTTARFTAAWGSRFDGRLRWVGGYTGLGVGASRFGAAVALDLVDGRRNERTELEMVRSKPFPLPPEPLRWLAIQMTRRAIVQSDGNRGRRAPLLRLLDRFGIGFDS